MIEVIHTYSGLSALWAGVIFGAAATLTSVVIGVLVGAVLARQGDAAAERAGRPSPPAADGFVRMRRPPRSRHP